SVSKTPAAEEDGDSAGKRGRQQPRQRVLVGVSRDVIVYATVLVPGVHDARPAAEIDLAAVDHAAVAQFDRLIARIEHQERDEMTVRHEIHERGGAPLDDD